MKFSLKNIKISNSIKQLGFASLFAGLCFLLFSAVGLKKDRAVAGVKLILHDNTQEHLIGKNYLQNKLRDEYGDLRNVPLAFIETKEMELFFEADPFIKNCEIYLDKTGKLFLDIFEKRPICRIMNDEKGVYLDDIGEKIPLSRYYTARVPVVFDKHNLLKDKKNMKKLVDLIQHVNKDEFMTALVDQLIIDEKGEYTIIPLLGKEKILFGLPDNLIEKTENLNIFYRKKIATGNWNMCRTLNVKIPGQVVCDKLITT